jgi:hypothetical protein
MRVYRTDRDGIEVLRVSGIIERTDTDTLVDFIGAPGPGGCCILDFTEVRHADYRVFRSLCKLIDTSPGVIFSGFSDYLLSIFAFVCSTKMTPVFSDWKAAFSYVKAERGKMGIGAAVTGAEEACPLEVGGR